MKRSTRHRLFGGGFAAINAIGADRWLRPFTLGSGMILMFHHVRPWQRNAFSPNASLEITPEFLALTVEVLRREGIDIIPLDDLPSRLNPGESQRPFAVLTFDDGYRDNLTYAAPVLRALNAPWTLYVVDDFARGHGSLWWLDLERAIAAGKDISVLLNDRTFRFQTGSLKQKYAAFNTLQRMLKAGPETQLHRVMSELRQRFTLDPDALVRDLCADWDELRSLAQDPHVTIGSHTLTHPILSRCGARKSEAEIFDSKDRIEASLGRPVRHLAFPHGDAGSAGLREFRLSRESGYDTAVTTRAGHIFAGSQADFWALPRVSINGLHQSEQALRALLSGAAFLPQVILRKKPTLR
ncbi:polysaccharide deacetylase family protein [Microvirga antarctica]|uniref:polysaccharide deacetylase family protein n=1 Tax=Microvirga antarctica TaxID=2819233 RepID=UPI001B3087D4|nr:polysaccharide deacetylase family protein [Microvirga antarctica]